MIRKILTIAAVILVIAVVFVFTGLNRGPITINLAFVEWSTQIPLAFIVTFILGWLFGLLCASLFLVSVLNERRKLRRSLRMAEAEVSSLRSLPLQDAGE